MNIKTLKRHNLRGFTILETLGTLVIFLVAVTLGLKGYIFMQKNSMKQYTQTEIDLNLRSAAQQLQNEMRLSAQEEMLFHPADAKKYTAVSFPINKAGQLSKTNGIILWDSTVIYHVVSPQEGDENSESKLMRTVISNRNNSLSTADRQIQLNKVVSDGIGDNAVSSGETASTKCLFEHVFNWEIIPIGSVYDGYASANTVDEQAYLGSFNLSEGEHTIQFEVIGKDSRSQGYRIALDTISFSHSQSVREAEDQSASGDPDPSIEPDQGNYSNYRKLVFDATEPGQIFEIKLYNDRWEDTLFNTIGSDSTNNVAYGYDSDYSPPEVTLCLDGSTTNQFAVNQTGDETGHLVIDDTFHNSIVRTLIKGEAIMAGANAGIAHEGEGCKIGFYCAYSPEDPYKGLRIVKAYIDECTSHDSATADTIGNPKQITFDDGNEKGAVFGPNPLWSDLLDYPISPEKNYAVTFQIESIYAFKMCPKTWESNTNIVNSYYLPQSVADPDALTATDWNSNTNVITSSHVIAAGEIYVSYPAHGVYTSASFDTHMERPQYESIDWDADCPEGTELKIEIRSASNSDMSDATGWKYICSPGSIGIEYLQYVQYRATFTSSAKGEKTAKLKNIAIKWPGEMSAAHLSGRLINGPDFGQFKTLIDGQELASPLRINLEVKAHPYGDDTTSTGTLISETSFELNPRNSTGEL